MFANNAVLVSLNISQWRARKQDKRATKDVAVQHNVDAGVGSYTKSLLPGSAELESVNESTGAARTFYYKATLPWGMEGSRILPNKNYFEFTQEMRGLKQEWENTVNQFCAKYPTLRQDAQQRLNGLFDPKDYPADVRKLFNFEINFFPVPQSGDFRIQLASEEMQKFEDNIRKAERDANSDLWERLYLVVTHAADRLRDPKAIFRDSLVQNAVELCELLPRLNFNDDPNLEEMRQALSSALCGHAPEALRQVPSLRQKTVSDLDNITSKINAYMGGM